MRETKVAIGREACVNPSNTVGLSCFRSLCHGVLAFKGYAPHVRRLRPLAVYDP
ncbi:hypothetical protein PT7_0234 [Pusillimonas sp. T7-7]|nr:hypothetical protein PT7_0234 [Pusillimonas sp. T7-7]